MSQKSQINYPEKKDNSSLLLSHWKGICCGRRQAVLSKIVKKITKLEWPPQGGPWGGFDMLPGGFGTSWAQLLYGPKLYLQLFGPWRTLLTQEEEEE